jgi:hypothetical protein
MQAPTTRPKITVSADGMGVVSHAGLGCCPVSRTRPR